MPHDVGALLVRADLPLLKGACCFLHPLKMPLHRYISDKVGVLVADIACEV